MSWSKKVLSWAAAIFICAVFLYGGTRIFVADSFIVRGHSMEPGFHDGEKIYAWKLKCGARIYTDYDFSSSKLKSFRMPGFGKIRAGDVVVLNYPYGRTEDTISFKINYVYLKKCYGAPGDTVRIENGFYIGTDGGHIGVQEFQEELHATPDSVLADRGVVLKAFSQNRRLGWTIRDFGPLPVPARGDSVTLDTLNWKTYRKMIQYETGEMPVRLGDDIMLGGIRTGGYRFRSDWYFFGGDNVLNSRDSRYIGLVPEEFIIGVVRTRGEKH